MKQVYLKPDAEYIDFALEEKIMDNVPGGNWSITTDDEEGIG